MSDTTPEAALEAPVETPVEPKAPEAPPEPAAPAAERSPYLTSAKMMPVEGVVYCLFHDAVHEDTTDPYDSGQDECEVKEHRTVYYRGRKGDVDETLAKQAERGVIAAAKSAELSDTERDLVVRLVDKAQRVTESAYASLSQVLGESSDEVQGIEKTLTALENTARKLDGTSDG